jgi:hypothetical protein
MNARYIRLVRVVLGAMIIAVWSCYMAAILVAETNAVEHTFGPSAKDGEQTYAWYRRTHAEAAKRYASSLRATCGG